MTTVTSPMLALAGIATHATLGRRIVPGTGRTIDPSHPHRGTSARHGQRLTDFSAILPQVSIASSNLSDGALTCIFKGAAVERRGSTGGALCVCAGRGGPFPKSGLWPLKAPAALYKKGCPSTRLPPRYKRSVSPPLPSLRRPFPGSRSSRWRPFRDRALPM
jgi:hypothetical protein